MPVEMSGLDELREALRQLPEDLTSEAAGIVHSHAERAMQDIGTSYPENTGNLRRGLILRTIGTAASARGHAGFGALVVNRAKHAYIYEHGSEQRYTDSGAAPRARCRPAGSSSRSPCGSGA